MGGPDHSEVEARFSKIRKRLDDAGYLESFGADSLRLVEHLFHDLIKTTESLQTALVEYGQYKKVADDLEGGVAPFKEENVRLYKENSHLRIGIAKALEEAEDKTRDPLCRIQDLEAENNDLKLLLSQFAERVKKADIDSYEKSKRIAKLQEKDVSGKIVVSAEKGGQGSNKQFRQSMELEYFVPDSCPQCIRLRNFVEYGKNSDRNPKTIDYVKLADSRIEALQLQLRSLKTLEKEHTTLISSLKGRVDVRDAEIERLRELIKIRPGQDNLSRLRDKESDKAAVELKTAEMQLQILQRRNIELEEKLKKSILQEHEEYMLGRMYGQDRNGICRGYLEKELDRYPSHDKLTLMEKLYHLEKQLSHCCKEKARLQKLLDERPIPANLVAQSLSKASHTGLIPKKGQSVQFKKPPGVVRHSKHQQQVVSKQKVGQGGILSKSGKGSVAVEEHDSSSKSRRPQQEISLPEDDMEQLSVSESAGEDEEGQDAYESADSETETERQQHQKQTVVSIKLLKGNAPTARTTKQDQQLQNKNFEKSRRSRHEEPKSSSHIGGQNIKQKHDSLKIAVDQKNQGELIINQRLSKQYDKKLRRLSPSANLRAAKESRTSYGSGYEAPQANVEDMPLNDNEESSNASEFTEDDSDGSDELEVESTAEQSFRSKPVKAKNKFTINHIPQSVLDDPSSIHRNYEDGKTVKSQKLRPGDRGRAMAPKKEIRNVEESGGDNQIVQKSSLKTKDINTNPYNDDRKYKQLQTKKPSGQKSIQPPNRTSSRLPSNKQYQPIGGSDTKQGPKIVSIDDISVPTSLLEAAVSDVDNDDLDGAVPPKESGMMKKTFTESGTVDSLSSGPEMVVQTSLQDNAFHATESTKKSSKLREPGQGGSGDHVDSDALQFHQDVKQKQRQSSNQQQFPTTKSTYDRTDSFTESLTSDHKEIVGSRGDVGAQTSLQQKQKVATRKISETNLQPNKSAKARNFGKEINKFTSDTSTNVAKTKSQGQFLRDQGEPQNVVMGSEEAELFPDSNTNTMGGNIPENLFEESRTVYPERRHAVDMIDRDYSRQKTNASKVDLEYASKGRRGEKEDPRRVQVDQGMGLRHQSSVTGSDVTAVNPTDVRRNIERNDRQSSFPVFTDENVKRNLQGFSNISKQSMSTIPMGMSTEKIDHKQTEFTTHYRDARELEDARNFHNPLQNDVYMKAVHENEKKALMAKISDLHGKMDELHADNSRHQLKTFELQGELERTRHNLQVEKQERDLVVSELKRLREQHNESTTRMLMTSTFGSDGLFSRGTPPLEMEREIANLRAALSNLDRDKDEMRVELDRKDEKLANLSHEASKYLDDISQLKLRLKNAELQINHTGESAKEQNREVEFIKKQLEANRRDLEKTVRERDEALKDLHKISGAFTKGKMERRSVESELEVKSKEAEDLRRQVQRYIDEVRRIEELLLDKEEEMEMLIQHYRALTAENNNLEAQRTSLEREASSIGESVRDTVDQNISFKTQLASQNTLVQSLEEEVQRLTQQISQLENQAETKTETVNTLNSDIKASKDLIYRLEVQMDKLKLDLADSESKRKQLEAESGELNAHITSLEIRLQEETERQQQLEGLVANSREKDFQMERTNVGISRERDELAEKLTNLQNRSESLTTEVSRYRLKSIELQNELDRNRRQLDSEKREREAALAELKRVRDQLSSSSANYLMNTALGTSGSSASQLGGTFNESLGRQVSSSSALFRQSPLAERHQSGSREQSPQIAPYTPSDDIQLETPVAASTSRNVLRAQDASRTDEDDFEAWDSPK